MKLEMDFVTARSVCRDPACLIETRICIEPLAAPSRSRHSTFTSCGAVPMPHQDRTCSEVRSFFLGLLTILLSSVEDWYIRSGCLRVVARDRFHLCMQE